MRIILNNNEYEIVNDYKNAFNLEDIEQVITDYFTDFDYILGDYAYNRLRLKGFYEDNSKNANEINKYSYLSEYVDEYCAYECRYFVLKKKKTQN